MGLVGGYLGLRRGLSWLSKGRSLSRGTGRCGTIVVAGLVLARDPRPRQEPLFDPINRPERGVEPSRDYSSIEG